jgi:serine/threonine-protein kinase
VPSDFLGINPVETNGVDRRVAPRRASARDHDELVALDRSVGPTPLPCNPRPVPLLAPGTVLSDRYVVGRVLGGGGMGEVYEAVQKGLSRRVAIKLLKPELATNPEMLSRFRREAEAAAALGHPNIVQVTDLCVQPNEPPYLVMEHLDGQSLHDLIGSEGRLTPERSVFIAMQILSALTAAHAAQIVHRDIKPANIFIQQTLAVSDIVKLLDFGVAKLLEPQAPGGVLTQVGEVLGTTSYMAPEQALGLPVDARADLFAVGAVLFHAVSGVRPREALDLDAAAFDRIKRLSEVAPWLDARLAAVVDRALHRDPNGRYPTAEEMVKDLKPFVPRAGVFDQTLRDRGGDKFETTQRDSAPPVTSKPTASMAERRAVPAPTPMMMPVAAQVAPTAPVVPPAAQSSPAVSGRASNVPPTVIEAPIRDSRQPPQRDSFGAPMQQPWMRPSYPSPASSERIISQLPPTPRVVPPPRSTGSGVVVGIVVGAATLLAIGLAIIGFVFRSAGELQQHRQDMLATATACPKPATCTGRVDLDGPLSVCAPQTLASTSSVRGDVVVVRRGDLTRLGRIEDVSSGGVFSLRDPNGSLTTFTKPEIQARVCR